MMPLELFGEAPCDTALGEGAMVLCGFTRSVERDPLSFSPVRVQSQPLNRSCPTARA